MAGLTPQQEQFCQLVAAGKTYADAYRGAYNVGKTTSSNTIYVKSSRMMDESKISLRVFELQIKTIKRNEVTLDEVLAEMAEWLKFNVKSIFNEDDTMKPLQEMSDQEASSIASFEVVELFDGSGDKKVQIGYLKKVKLIDKRAVADMFLRKLGAYIDNHKITIEDMSHLKDLLNGIKE